MQNNMQNMYIPRFWYKTIVKKNSKYLYLTSDLPAAGRLGVEVKNLHNITKYVEYAKYDSTLQLHNLGLCCSWNMQNIIGFAQYSVCVCSMQQCPAASNGCPSSDCVAATEQGSRPLDSSLSDKVMARCTTKNRY